jgi:hypothetical protein
MSIIFLSFLNLNFSLLIISFLAMLLLFFFHSSFFNAGLDFILLLPLSGLMLLCIMLFIFIGGTLIFIVLLGLLFLCLSIGGNLDFVEVAFFYEEFINFNVLFGSPFSWSEYFNSMSS